LAISGIGTVFYNKLFQERYRGELTKKVRKSSMNFRKREEAVSGDFVWIMLCT